MAALLDRFEHFLDHYPRIIAAVEAISTFAAVVVALWLARRGDPVRLRAVLSVGLSTTDPSRRSRCAIEEAFSTIAAS